MRILWYRIVLSLLALSTYAPVVHTLPSFFKARQDNFPRPYRLIQVKIHLSSAIYAWTG